MSRAEVTNQDIIDTLLDFMKSTNERFDMIDRRFESIDKRLVRIEKDIKDIIDSLHDFAIYTEERFEAIEIKVDAVNHRLDQIEVRLQVVEGQVRVIGYELREAKRSLTDLDGRLIAAENDIKDIFFQLPRPGAASV